MGWRLREAERWSRRAIRLGLGDAENHAGLANVLSFVGRSEEAIELMHNASRYNPIRPPLHEFYLAHLGRIPEAAAALVEWERQCGVGAPRAHF